MSSTKPTKLHTRCYSIHQHPSVDDFISLCCRTVNAEDYPLCSDIQSKIPFYNLPSFLTLNPSLLSSLQDEWHHILLSGPGVFVIRKLYEDKSLIDNINAVYQEIIQTEASSTKGDHFASSSQNSRIWNSFSKHALHSPSTFLQYYSNPYLSLISSAWLGPGYRITAQVNIVKPGGAAQVCHRDYHLGIQTAEAAAQFPKSVQAASQFLTLQGAVAHTDMPAESGPTRFLPFSQMFQEGYMAYRLPEFAKYFEENYVALPLEKGDAVFFNPALFHAAGENKTQDFQRSANLLQISSAFGKTMESVDSLPLVERCWEGLRKMYAEKAMSAEVEAAVMAVGEGYPFPTNLDKRPPAPGGMAPESEQGLLRRGLAEGWDERKVMQELRQLREGSKA